MVRLGPVSLSDQNLMEDLRTKGEAVGMEGEVIGMGGEVIGMEDEATGTEDEVIGMEDEVVTVEEVKMVGFLVEPDVSECCLAYPHRRPIDEF